MPTRTLSLVPRTLIRFLVLALVLGTLFVDTPIAQAQTNCRQSSPTSNAYTVTTCFSDPIEGDVLVGAEMVEVTVSVTGTVSSVKTIIIRLNGEYVLTDSQSPYRFSLPTDQWSDGSRQLEAQATLTNGFVAEPAGITVTFVNGVTAPVASTKTFTPTTGSTPDPGQPFVLTAVGDGANGRTTTQQVSNLVASWNPNLFLYLGDVYQQGTFTEFSNWYGTGEQGFSRLRSVTNPTIGNHEYLADTTAKGYFTYWNGVPDYYSIDVAGWHIVSLNSTTQFNQTMPGAPQYEWLVQDLASSTAACTMVYVHHPAYSIGNHGDNPHMQPIWQLLAEHSVDVVLAGHEHTYQRWTPLDGTGIPSASGITQFVVGTGGASATRFTRTDSRLVAGFDTAPNAFGALRMKLSPDGATYQYVSSAGNVLDTGSLGCQSAPKAEPDTTPPLGPSASPAGGIYSGSQAVTLTAEPGATIRYTTDGSEPTLTSGTLYSQSISISSTTTLKAVAIDSAGNVSTVMTETYTIEAVAPVTAPPGPPSKLSIIKGTLVSGSVSQLAADDGANVVIGSVASGSSQTVVFSGEYSVPRAQRTLLGLSVSYDGGASVGTATRTLSLFNVQTGTWEALKTEAQPTTDLLTTITASGDVTRFMSSTGLVRLRVQVTNTQSFELLADAMSFTVTYQPGGSPVTEALVASAFTIQQGTVVAGSVTSLAADDTSDLVIAATPNSTTSTTRTARFYGSVTLPTAKRQVTGVSITYDGGTSINAVSRTVALFNFRTGVWEVLATVNQPTANTDVATTIMATGDVTRFVSSTGQVRMRIAASKAAVFDLQADLMRFTITYQP